MPQHEQLRQTNNEGSSYELEGLRKFTKQAWVNQHGSEDRLTGMSEGEHSDLYNDSLNPYMNSIELSGPNSSDHIGLLYPVDEPR